MSKLFGEFDCKLDAKGRLMVPAMLKKKLPDVEREGLMICRGFENSLIIYPMKVWEKMEQRLEDVNYFQKEGRGFLRSMLRGLTELSLDAAGRVLLPKILLDHAGITSELVLVGQLDKIEVWDKATYEASFAQEQDEDFAEKAERVLGRQKGVADGE